MSNAQRYRNRIAQAEEQRQMRDEYHAMEERVAELEDALRECEELIDEYIDAEKPRGVHPKWDKDNAHLKELNPARLALQEAR